MYIQKTICTRQFTITVIFTFSKSKVNALGKNYVIKTTPSLANSYKHINSAETDNHNMSIIQSRHDLLNTKIVQVSPTAFPHPNMQLVF